MPPIVCAAKVPWERRGPQHILVLTQLVYSCVCIVHSLYMTLILFHSSIEKLHNLMKFRNWMGNLELSRWPFWAGTGGSPKGLKIITLEMMRSPLVLKCTTTLLLSECVLMFHFGHQFFFFFFKFIILQLCHVSNKRSVTKWLK